ncbi:MAG: MFS transporter [Acidobacteriia bacterium]|nr:MFS transporter [Terriglobia bacterium]
MEPEPSRLAATFRALAHRNFRLFFSGQFVSLVGTWMQQVAQSWLVYRLTGSALLLGMVGFAGQFPVFLFGPFGGAIADRANRHRVVIATQTAAMMLAFVLAALTLMGTVRVWHVFVLSALLGVVNAVDIPVRQAFVVDMVGKDDLMNAIALNSSMVNGTRIVGPAIAGVLVAAFGEGWCFFGNGVSYIAVIISLLFMNIRPVVRSRGERSALADIIEGVHYSARTAPIRDLLLLLGLMSLMGMPYAVLMPIFADQILHGGARGLGILMGATGVGALLGALTLATRRGLTGLGKWVAVSAAGFGACLILFAFSRNFWLSAALLLPVGFCFMLEMASSNTLIQAMVPDELRGRVMALYAVMFMGMAPFGALLAGALAHGLSAPVTVAIGGAVCVVGGIAFAVRLPQLRAEARQLIVAQQASGGALSEEVTGTTPQGEIAREIPSPASG